MSMSWAVGWHVNYQKKRDEDRECMSPVPFRLCQSMRRGSSLSWRMMGLRSLLVKLTLLTGGVKSVSVIYPILEAISMRKSCFQYIPPQPTNPRLFAHGGIAQLGEQQTEVAI